MKTAIIGGGICGLYLAKNLAQKGIQTTVFERKKTLVKSAVRGYFPNGFLSICPKQNRWRLI